jgi:hypothetical protein
MDRGVRERGPIMDIVDITHTKENVLNNDYYQVQTYIHMDPRKCSSEGVQGVNPQTNL